ncbi:acylneuraminate cytidylyltransferase [Chryseobacterium sp. SC28]|uniref:acylneuraminate cytidylyltransferase n=1 Tax=Chryseobacterium sp. SC28 TaxID=2268028 RepID=UPI000F647396|nr:acylneuraminate cytidylyltransferase [Chryseobacterium sp. SC28]RRQ45839.1 acylneuraminate cytidylyltransferase [Chryseobacterium sp. SC28]
MTIAFIPVRGGSQSIPLKNIKSFCGKPLVFWNIYALEDTPAIDKIVVATDSAEIEEAIRSFNFQKTEIYHRSAENAQDTSSTESVMLEYLHQSGSDADDVFILVQATSPLTQSKDFSAALELYKHSDYDSLLTGVRFKRFFWNEDGSSKNYDYQNRPRRQDFKGEFMENGAFYVNRVGNILRDRNRLSGKIALFEMEEFTAFEIDEPDDWAIAEALMKKHILPLQQAPTQIKLFLTDVDGVLTDAGMYYSENGDELKKFNTRDGMGFDILRQHGIKTGIVTSEITQMVERRAQKLKVDYLYQGKREGGKLEAALEICAQEGISIKEVAYIGDDINCYALLSEVGMAACPQDASAIIKSVPGIRIMTLKGGEGCVREFIDKMIIE